jgi:uncharacterized protein YdbL (DUF1318 family)
MTTMKKGLWLLIPVFICGCTLAKVNVEMLSERTALENQVLGTYNSLDTQMLLAASVRGVDSSGNIAPPPKHSPEYNDVIAAMQILDFNADDLERFKRLGWVGENNQGLITPFEADRKNSPEELKEFAAQISSDEFNHIIEQINQSRKLIMRHTIYMNENLTEADLPEIERVFAKINAENAEPGDKIQSEDGSWKIKKG